MRRFWLAALLSVLMPAAFAAAEVNWHHWEIAAFEKAKAEDKMIMVSVGMEGCVACARMDALTYTNQAVIDRLNEHFVTIEVDAESRPDIGERYSDWAWPATIFLAPDATQVLALRGNRLPRNFIPILDDLLAKQQAGKLEPDPRSPYAAPPKPADTDLSRMRDGLRGQLDRALNRKYGGWGRGGMGGEQSGSRLRHLYLRAHLYDDAELKALALKSSASFLNAIDPVWGGVYIAAFPKDMELPDRFSKLRAIPEKRILVQSNAITAFALGYKHTGEQKYLDGIAAVDRYLNEWMRAADGTYYTNQKSQPRELPDDMSSADYWLLDTDAKRRAFGTPPIDRAVHTDKNGEVISAYVLAYESTGNVAYLESAKRTANAILDGRLKADGWLVQTSDNDKIAHATRLHSLVTEERPFLSAQAWFGTALLGLYRTTGDEKWLAAAETIGTATLALLHDDKVGGFYATTPDPTAAIIAPRKPLESNGTAASFFYDLGIYVKNPAYTSAAQKALSAVGLPGIIRREGKITGEFAMALEKVTTAYVEFSVVGDKEHPNAKALFDAGFNVFEPRKLLHYEQPGRYPDRGVPAMYICNPDMCTVPILDASQVADQAIAFRGPATNALTP